jgi:hypothetical protein
MSNNNTFKITTPGRCNLFYRSWQIFRGDSPDPAYHLRLHGFIKPSIEIKRGAKSGPTIVTTAYESGPKFKTILTGPNKEGGITTTTLIVTKSWWGSTKYCATLASGKEIEWRRLSKGTPRGTLGSLQIVEKEGGSVLGRFFSQRPLASRMGIGWIEFEESDALDEDLVEVIVLLTLAVLVKKDITLG